MKRLLIFPFLCGLLLAGCKKEVDQKELISNVAKQYYAYLLNGNYDAYVDATYRPDSIRAEYRQQLLESAKMFVAQQQAEHKGIKDCDVTSVDIDTLGGKANVFMVLNYGDKTQEEILLPMVKHEENWYLR